MNAVATVNGNGGVPAVQTEAAGLLAVISQAAANPQMDVTKLERLMDLYERVNNREAKRDYDQALAEMQPNLPVIRERGKIQIGSNEAKAQKYALWEDINEAIKPVLAQHGFAISFRVGHVENKISVTGILSHRGGHREETTMLLPIDNSGSKNAVQAVGSSASYGKRYTAGALLNLTSTGEDDDGKAAGDGGKISNEQRDAILKLVNETGSDIEKLCKYFKVDAIPDIPAKEYERVIALLNEKRKAR